MGTYDINDRHGLGGDKRSQGSVPFTETPDAVRLSCAASMEQGSQGVL